MIKTKNKHITALSLVCVLLVGVLLSFGSSTISAARALDFHGIDVSDRTTITGYYMDIPLSKAYGFDFSGHKTTATNGMDLGTPFDRNVFSRKDVQCNIMVTFHNIRTKADLPIYVMAVGVVNLPSVWSSRVVLPDITVSLTYNYFIMLYSGTPDYTNVSISLIHNDKMSNVFHSYFTTGLNDEKTLDRYSILETKIWSDPNVPIGVIDPESPDYDLDFGNTGTNQGTDELPDIESPNRENMTLIDRLLAAFFAVWNGGADIWDWVLFGGALIVGLILLGFVGKVLAFITKLFK